MLRIVIVAALLGVSLPLSSDAGELEIVGGAFAFLHEPVDPASPDGFCEDPPGLLFSVESDIFGGELLTTNGNIMFTGEGDAIGCAYLEPADGISARFVGSFVWQTSRGELRGTFELLDTPTEIRGLFASLIFITFDGGTGRFKNATGHAIAEGFDFPFGGLWGTAGVVATSVQGKVELEKSAKVGERAKGERAKGGRRR